MRTQQLRYVFLLLAIAGVALPYMAFVPFLLTEGFNLTLFFEQATANRISQFAWLDVIVTAITILFAAFAGQFVTKKQALLVTVLTFCAGSSAGLPLLLYFMLDKHRGYFTHLSK